MKTLYVLYDERCAICKRLKEWLLVQRSWIGLSMVPAGSSRAKAMFPALEKIAGSNDLVVISDEGEVYLNNHAWIMCLYALEEYRHWALRLASPLLLPLARQAFDTLSKNRQAISRWASARSTEKEIAEELGNLNLEPCPVEGTQDVRENAASGNKVGEYLR
jgi:predicted DCC family thiol-disulfide oxidoreductase YuxK